VKGKMSKANRKKGLVIVNTGDGKGKTTAASACSCALGDAE